MIKNRLYIYVKELKIMGKKNFPLVSNNDNDSKCVTKKGTFEEGVDGRGNPYRKETDELTGIYTKEEYLHDGTRKLTAKIPPEN